MRGSSPSGSLVSKTNMAQKSSDVSLIIYHDLGIGGVQRKIADIATFLNTSTKYGNENLYIVLDSKRNFDLDEDIFLKEILKNGVKVFYKPQQKIWRFKFPLSLYVFWKIFILKPKKILAFMRRFSIIAILMKYVFWWRGIKVIVSYDNIASLLIPAQFKRRPRMVIWTTLMKLLYSRADRVILPSDVAAKDMIENFGVPRDKIAVNKNWVSSKKSSKQNKIYDLIYTGRIDPVKNLSMFVEVINTLKKSKKGIKGCILGWGEEMDRVSNLAEAKSLNNSIEFLGSQIDVSQYLSKSKIFLLTSKFEGLPISALEAMAHKLPVVTIAYPGADELVSNGVDGYICKNKKELVEKIQVLLTNNSKRREMGNKAMRKVTLYHGQNNLEDFVQTSLGI